MQPSIAGVLICCAIFGMARFTQMPAVVVLIASLAFGSTAIVTLPALGGSSPMIFVVFLGGLLATVAFRRNFARELGTVFSQQPIAWLLVVLVLYAVAGAYFLPRLFAGQASAFIPQRDGIVSAGIIEVPLGPVSGNITQTLYFVFGVLAFFALSVLLPNRRTLAAVRQGFFVWTTLHVSMGLIDLFGKIAGLEDILLPIRSASYAMATSVDVLGFWRIAGAYSEASAFGAVTVSLLAFTFTYWRSTLNKFALVLTVLLVVLLILSTSTTAYVAGAIVALYVLVSIASNALQKSRLRRQDLQLLMVAFLGLAVALGIEAYCAKILNPLWNLLDTMVLNKASSNSAYERSYWNYQSLLAVVDTMGLGIGFGSSRASSWIISVISQLGIIGSIMMGLLTLEIVRGSRLRQAFELDGETRVTILSVRAAALAVLLTSSISGGAADPGLVFFIALAVVSSYRRLPAMLRYRPIGRMALNAAQFA